jgi:predicted MPP superfamily phosphohydrolase
MEYTISSLSEFARMATPAIALRFRDTTFGIDTIEAHREVLANHAKVWWGWWKKEFEEIDPALVDRTLRWDAERKIVLVNRAAERSYLATFSAFAIGSGGVDKERVPAYYRNHIHEVAAFFLLSSIDNYDYDPQLGERLGERTFMWLREEETDFYRPHLAPTADAVERSCILHLSDLHFGSDYGFLPRGKTATVGDTRRTLTECLIRDLERIGLKEDVGFIIISGDFISQGDWSDPVRGAALNELSALREELGLQKDQIVAIPGNHDIVRYPDGKQVDVADITVDNQTSYQHEREFRTFVEELVDRSWRASLNYVRRVRLSAVDLQLCMMNSCTITATQWTEYGYVGPNGIDALHQLAKEKIVRPTFRFLALHHHLLPVAAVEAPQSRGVTLTLDASRILTEAQKAGVHVALHGHQHKPKIAVYQDLAPVEGAPGRPICVVANGSAGAKSDRLPFGERNTYCLFRLSVQGAELWMRELRLDGEPGAELFHDELPTHPASQPA